MISESSQLVSQKVISPRQVGQRLTPPYFALVPSLSISERVLTHTQLGLVDLDHHRSSCKDEVSQ